VGAPGLDFETWDSLVLKSPPTYIRHHAVSDLVTCRNENDSCGNRRETLRVGRIPGLRIETWGTQLGCMPTNSLRHATRLSRGRIGDSDFRLLEVLLHNRPLPVNTIGPKVWLTQGSISVAVDRLEKKALVKRKNTGDRRVRLVELTTKDARSSPSSSIACGRHGRGRRRPLRGEGNLAAAPWEVGKPRKDES
jgi:hypothetical protein